MPDDPNHPPDQPPPGPAPAELRPMRIVLAVTRVVLPATMAIVGVIAIVIGHGKTPVAGAGVVLLGFAVIVWMINWLFRMSVRSNRDREREEEAREYFAQHGRWPGE